MTELVTMEIRKLEWWMCGDDEVIRLGGRKAIDNCSEANRLVKSTAAIIVWEANYFQFQYDRKYNN